MPIIMPRSIVSPKLSSCPITRIRRNNLYPNTALFIDIIQSNRSKWVTWLFLLNLCAKQHFDKYLLPYRIFLFWFFFKEILQKVQSLKVKFVKTSFCHQLVKSTATTTAPPINSISSYSRPFENDKTIISK